MKKKTKSTIDTPIRQMIVFFILMSIMSCTYYRPRNTAYAFEYVSINYEIRWHGSYGVPECKFMIDSIYYSDDWIRYTELNRINIYEDIFVANGISYLRKAKYRKLNKKRIEAKLSKEKWGETNDTVYRKFENNGPGLGFPPDKSRGGYFSERLVVYYELKNERDDIRKDTLYIGHWIPRSKFRNMGSWISHDLFRFESNIIGNRKQLIYYKNNYYTSRKGDRGYFRQLENAIQHNKTAIPRKPKPQAQ